MGGFTSARTSHRFVKHTSGPEGPACPYGSRSSRSSRCSGCTPRVRGSLRRQKLHPSTIRHLAKSCLPKEEIIGPSFPTMWNGVVFTNRIVLYGSEVAVHSAMGLRFALPRDCPDAKFFEFSQNAGVSPARFFCQLDDQFPNVLRCPWSARFALGLFLFGLVFLAFHPAGRTSAA